MNKQLFGAAMLSALIFTGCQLVPSDTAPFQTTLPVTAGTSSAIPTATVPPASTSYATGSSAPPQTSPLTSPAGSRPIRGILSESKEYVPGNPMSHALNPVERKLSALPDKTRKENEKYRPFFEEYLNEFYPEYDFRITDIMDYQSAGRTLKKSRAWAAQSTDTAMDLFFDGDQITDSFEQDVIGRRNTMNRWRTEFRKILDPLVNSTLAGNLITPDISFDYYKENTQLIRLDEPLEPRSDRFVRCLELYVKKGQTDPVKISEAAHAIYQAVLIEGYAFQDYYIYLEEETGTRSAWKVPPRLVGSASFPAELQKALTGDHPQNLIQRTARPMP